MFFTYIIDSKNLLLSMLISQSLQWNNHGNSLPVDRQRAVECVGAGIRAAGISIPYLHAVGE